MLAAGSPGESEVFLLKLNHEVLKSCKPSFWHSCFNVKLLLEFFFSRYVFSIFFLQNCRSSILMASVFDA